MVRYGLLAYPQRLPAAAAVCDLRNPPRRRGVYHRAGHFGLDPSASGDDAMAPYTHSMWALIVFR